MAETENSWSGSPAVKGPNDAVRMVLLTIRFVPPRHVAREYVPGANKTQSLTGVQLGPFLRLLQWSIPLTTCFESMGNRNGLYVNSTFSRARLCGCAE